MGFGGEVDDGVDLLVFEELLDQCSVIDAAVDEAVVAVIFQTGEVLQVARVGQCIEIDQAVVAVMR